MGGLSILHVVSSEDSSAHDLAKEVVRLCDKRQNESSNQQKVDVDEANGSTLEERSYKEERFDDENCLLPRENVGKANGNFLIHLPLFRPLRFSALFFKLFAATFSSLIADSFFSWHFRLRLL
jgi:hypothetical protein